MRRSRSTGFRQRALLPLLFAGTIGLSQAPSVGGKETLFLTFQVFTGGTDPRRPFGDESPLPRTAPSKELIRTVMVEDIIGRIGGTGDSGRKLGFVVGPLALDHGDEELRRLVRESFEIAAEKDISVGFHIDDSMFWSQRTELSRDPQNIEWVDWQGTPNTGREIDWGKRIKIAPQLCFNSPAVRDEVRRIAKEVVGAEVRKGLDTLVKLGKPELFACVILGWETHIGKDFESGKPSGFRAMVNRGFSAAQPPKDIDRERESIVEEFIQLWGRGVEDAGVPANRIYSHIWSVSQAMYKEVQGGFFAKEQSLSQLANFTPLHVAFGSSYRPGFSTYPAPGVFEEIHALLAQRNNPPWASTEGTNIRPGLGVGSSGMSMETYLAKMFNHGATLTTIFSWGIGGDQFKNLDFRVVTEGPDAIEAYRKFLRGDVLIEGPVVIPPKPGPPIPLFILLALILGSLLYWMRRRRRRRKLQGTGTSGAV